MDPQDKPDEVTKPEAKPASSNQRFEAELASLTPRPPQLDRDRLMFLAGQASVPSILANRAERHWPWPAAFSAMTALAASLLMVLALRPEPRVVERIVQVPVEIGREPNTGSAERPSRSDRSSRQLGGNELAADVRRAPPRKTPPVASYLDLRDQVLAMGIDSWQTAGAARTADGGESPLGYHDLLDNLLHGG